MEVRETVTKQTADGQVGTHRMIPEAGLVAFVGPHGQLVGSSVEMAIPGIVDGSVGLLVGLGQLLASRASSQEDELAQAGDH